MNALLFILAGILGCGVLGLIALFMAADRAAKEEGEKQEPR